MMKTEIHTTVGGPEGYTRCGRVWLKTTRHTRSAALLDDPRWCETCRDAPKPESGNVPQPIVVEVL